MVHHIILWKLRDDLRAEEKKVVMEDIKINLEALIGTVEAINTIKVNISNLASSNVDIMLDATFNDKAGLDEYQNHPAHQHAANTYVRPFISVRSCIDYED